MTKPALVYWSIIALLLYYRAFQMATEG